MRHSSSPSTPRSSASRSPYASFFDLESVFRCGCTSDVHESEHECLEPKSPRHAQHEEEELEMESAKDYVERISKDLASMEKKDSIEKPKYSRQVSIESESSITTVFRMSTSSTSTINNSRYPSLKHTESQCTQETEDISDDELSLESQEEEEESIAQHPVSILRRKQKLGEITAPRGGSVTFCPSTVFPDPSQKRRRPRRRRKPKQQELQIFVPATCEEVPLELRRLERRAQQNQYASYLTHDLRSPSSDLLLPTESFYVFR